MHWRSVPAEVDDYAKSHLVWDALLSDLNVPEQRVIYPNFQDLLEVLFRGRRPTAFTRALLDRRFDAIFNLPREDQRTRTGPDAPGEDNYFWKLNRVAEYKYAPAPRNARVPVLPGGEAFASAAPARPLLRRPGPDPAPWLASCFGPFRMGGLEVEISGGGGLWCRERGSVMHLRETPAPESELVSTGDVGPFRGVLGIGVAPRVGGWRIEHGDDWALRSKVRADLSGIDVVLARTGRPPARAHIDRQSLGAAGGSLRLVFDPAASARLRTVGPARLVVPSSVQRAKIQIWASRESDAKLNFRRFRAE
jgi:hypothetical protein